MELTKLINIIYLALWKKKIIHLCYLTCIQRCYLNSNLSPILNKVTNFFIEKKIQVLVLFKTFFTSDFS
jgi:hypothetical protein